MQVKSSIYLQHIRGLLHKTFMGEKLFYFNWNFYPMLKSMAKLCLPEFSDFTRVFSLVKVLCNRLKVRTRLTVRSCLMDLSCSHTNR